MSKKASKGINCDIVVSCHCEEDKEFVKSYFLPELQKAHFVVWFAEKAAKEKDSGLAILQCKIFLPILSVDGVDSSDFNDNLSLAYVSNKSIVPVARKGIRKINPLLNSGVQLMLAKINWTFFIKEESYADSMPKLVDALKNEIILFDERKAQNVDQPEFATEEDAFNALNSHAPNIESQEVDLEGQPLTCEHLQKSINCDFWERHFQGKKEVTWTDFKTKFIQDYGERINRQLGGGKDTWVTLILYKDIFELRKIVTRQMYASFAGHNPNANPDHFFDRVKEYAVGISAMKKIFHMDSSVRLVAIQNLGTFQTPAVITLLFDLVADEDPNVRALASLALAKTGKKSHRIEEKLIKLLGDEDRVVRESACLSLAAAKCTRAVDDILDLWRNDAIKHVREAAELALQRMGGPEAEQAIKVTGVLTREMEALRQGTT